MQTCFVSLQECFSEVVISSCVSNFSMKWIICSIFQVMYLICLDCVMYRYGKIDAKLSFNMSCTFDIAKCWFRAAEAMLLE